MSIDYDKFEPEGAEARSSWSRELVTTHSVSLKTGSLRGCTPQQLCKAKLNVGQVGLNTTKQLKNGSGFGILNILEVLGGLFISIYREFRLI